MTIKRTCKICGEKRDYKMLTSFNLNIIFPEFEEKPDEDYEHILSYEVCDYCIDHFYEKTLKEMINILLKDE